MYVWLVWLCYERTEAKLVPLYRKILPGDGVVGGRVGSVFAFPKDEMPLNPCAGGILTYTVMIMGKILIIFLMLHIFDTVVFCWYFCNFMLILLWFCWYFCNIMLVLSWFCWYISTLYSNITIYVFVTRGSKHVGIACTNMYIIYFSNRRVLL